MPKPTKQKGRPVGSKNKPKVAAGDGAPTCHATQAIFVAYRDAVGAPGSSTAAERTAPPPNVPTRAATIQSAEGALTLTPIPAGDLSARGQATLLFHSARDKVPQPTRKVPGGQPLAYPRLPEGALYVPPP